MTLELRVPGRQQMSQMSCWWACMAMVLEYYGRDYTYPWQFNAQFARPWNRPRDGSPDMVYESFDVAFERHPDLPAFDARHYLEPYEWYEHGLPANRAAFERLAEISGFRGFDRPAFGEWSAEAVETRLRSHGPFVFFGSWNGFPHAILTVGVIERGAGAEAEIVTIDPIRGFATQELVGAFNRRMVQRLSGADFASLNPMHYPTRQPVRDVVSHDG